MDKEKRLGLPENAKRVFKGKIFEVWQWPQKLFDGSTAVFEKIWRPPTVEVIATAGDKIIIERQDQPDRFGNINLVSGRPAEGEEPLAAAKRELLEETGCQSSDWSLLLKHGRDGKIIHDVYYFIARECRKVAEPRLDAGERIGAELIAFEELLALADEPKFWVSAEFINYILRIRADKERAAAFRNMLFPHR